MGAVTQRQLVNVSESCPPAAVEVLDRVVEGQTTKEVAFTLGLSHKTIETHRARIMRKMHARSVAELVHMILAFRSE